MKILSSLQLFNNKPHQTTTYQSFVMHNPLSLSPNQGKTIPFSNWNSSTNNTKSISVKIVYPGGNVELYNRPVLAVEILVRNPDCCVAHPNVYKQPWAIVAPDTTLTPGQKFYVVPTATITRLQRCSLRYSHSMVQTRQSGKFNKKDDTIVSASSCWLFMSKKKRSSKKEILEKDGSCCFTCLLRGIIKIKTKSEDSLIKKTRSPSIWGSSETRKLMRKRTKNVNRNGGFLNRLESFDQWEPSLESISEE